MTGLALSFNHPWLLCQISTFRFARKGRLPYNLVSFLDDAHRLGLLRAIGPIYQFRHAELHDHLASDYSSAGSEILAAPTTPRQGARSAHSVLLTNHAGPVGSRHM